ncbi:MBOAT family O-acyltransferase [Desulfosediminicola sp.]|uniref:MBOAT family O-acyltransferase n=1 Tax=Desulfosediminicola sp. TaxID=2886825 RepID=UPI003AF221F7
MVFSTSIFLFIFLPVVLAVYMVAGPRLRNITLLVSSLFFYAWGEHIFVFLMLGSIVINWLFGLLIGVFRNNGNSGRLPLFFGVGANLGLLGLFKYANFFIANLNPLLLKFQLAPIELEEVHLPIGISFFTFQAISYLVDVYRLEAKPQKNLIQMALYISLFPQLIAGPIIRYKDIAGQIANRAIKLDHLVNGIQRFIIGLGKKVLLANVLGRTADHIFSLPADALSADLAWLGAVSYMLQIYFDFSGYSDMAIGLGLMFGFRFAENFNLPYSAVSIREFWQRWHISLSTWFRDYLYIPLGGSKRGALTTYRNLVIVFLLCGLWHGASWTFIAWGLYHGVFLVLERNFFISLVLGRLPRPLQHLYVLTVVLCGWVLFRAESLPHAGNFLLAMITFTTPAYFDSQLYMFLNNEFYLALTIAIVASTPVLSKLRHMLTQLENEPQTGTTIIRSISSVCTAGFLSCTFLYAIASIIGGDYNPFLYFRF